MNKHFYWFSTIAIVVTFSYLLPNHHGVWRTVYQDMAMFLGLLITVAWLGFNQKNIVSSISFYSILLLATVPWLQCGFGQIFFFGDALMASVYLVGFAFANLVGFNLVKVFGLDRILAYWGILIVFIALICVYIQFEQWLLLANGSIWIADMPLGGRPFANFAQPNSLATFLCLSLMASLYLFEKNRLGVLAGTVLALFLLFGIALTQSRTAWCFFLVFLIVWVAKYNYINARLLRMVPFAYLTVFMLFLLILPKISNFLGVSVVSSAVQRASSGFERFEMWYQTLYAIAQRPFFGYGWNQVSVAQVSVTRDFPVPIQFDSSHNIVLDLLIWNGIPLGLLIVGVSIWRLYNFIRTIKSIEIFIALAMLGVILTHAMLEYPLAYAFFLLPFGMLFGAVEATYSRVKTYQLNNLLLNFAIIGCIVLFVVTSIEYRKIEKSNELLQYELRNIGSLHSDVDTPNVILLTQLREYIRFLRTPPSKPMNSENIAWAKKVTYRYPITINLYRYAQILAYNHNQQLALEQLEILNNLYNINFPIDSLYDTNDSLSFKWQK